MFLRTIKATVLWAVAVHLISLSYVAGCPFIGETVVAHLSHRKPH